MRTDKFIFVFAVCLAGLVHGAALPLHHFSYVVDFEDGKDPLELVGGKNYTVNFKGVTGEKSFSGKKSFKIDVSFGEDGECTWRIPVKVIAEGSLQFTAGVFIGEETKAPGKGNKFKIGTNFSFWPVFTEGYTGINFYPGFREAHKGQWHIVDVDAVEKAMSRAETGCSANLWGVPHGSLGKYVKDVFVSMSRMQKGGRLVVYIDDIKLEGEIPAEDVYRQETEARWAPVREKTLDTAATWETKLKQTRDYAASLANLPQDAEKIRKRLIEKLDSSSSPAAYQSIRRTGVIPIGFYNKIQDIIGTTDMYLQNIKILADAKQEVMPYRFYNVRPIITPEQRILPDDVLVYGQISLRPQVEVTTCWKKYEPASFVLSAVRDITGLDIRTGKLMSLEGSLDPGCVDLRVVKCWYQNANGNKVLIPELLLHDDALVRVDYEKKENYVRLSFPQGEKYFRASDPDMPADVIWDPGTYNRDRTMFRNEDYPIKDAPRFVPVDIPAGHNKQFWLTVRVPEGTKTGLYEGTMELVAQGKLLGSVEIKINVLPVKLPPAFDICTIYGMPQLNLYNRGTVRAERKTEQQFRAMIENMYAHGITHPRFNVNAKGYLGLSLFDEEIIRKELAIIREIIPTDKQPFLGPSITELVGGMGSPPPIVWKLTPEQKQELQENAARIIRFAQAYGYGDVYFYGIDEATGDRLAGQRELWEAVREAGGKVFVTGGKGETGNLELMGDIQDMFVSYDHPSREEAEEWHGLGHKILSVWNAAGRYGGRLGSGREDPEAHRRNYGLMIWKSNYDGTSYYAYTEWFAWNDFDKGKTGRSCAMVYPTVDGVIDTVQWEGYREGVDDVRYAVMLENLIAQAKQTGKKQAEAAAAEKYLDSFDTEYGDLDQIRSEIIGHILKLM